MESPKAHTPRPIRVARRFLAMFLPVSALVLGGFHLFHHQQAGAELALLRSDQAHGVKLMRRSLEGKLAELQADLLVLAQSPELKGWPQSPREWSKARLAGLFQSLLRNHPGYEQARLLDLRGREVVRVERREGGVRRTPDSKLQDKSDRYYYLEAIGLHPGQVYLSRLDLNRERGRVERPPKPMLRLATPLYDAWRRRRGLVVINYRAARLLADLRALAPEPGRPLLVDHQGYPLLGPAPGRLWGSDLPGRPSLAESDPGLWAALTASREGRHRAPEGLYTFTTLRPSAAAPRAPFWKLATLVPAPALRALEARGGPRLAGLAAGVLLLSAAGLWLLARNQGRRAAAEAESRRRAENQEILGRLLALGLEDEELPRLMERALEAVLEASWLRTLPQGGVFLADAGGRLHLAASRGLGPEVERRCASVPPGRCHCGRAAATGELQFSSRVDHRHDTELPGAADHGHYNAPFMHAGRCLGVMVLYLPPGAAFSSEEESFVWSAARTLALVIVRRQAVEARAESRARLQAVVDSAVEGIVTINSRGVVESLNQAAERLFGYRAEEVVGRNVAMLAPPEVASRHDEFLRRYLATGEARIIGVGREVTGLRKDGSRFPLYLSVGEVRVGERLLFTGILRDITRLKEYERRLRRARDQAEAANRELVEKQRRLDEDLAAAAGIQEALLPQQPPRAPEVEMAWRFVPSQHIGGDLLDVFRLGPDHLAFYLLDVSGHGAPAALVTVSLHQTLDPGGGLVLRRGPAGGAPAPPAEVLAALDRQYPLERFDKFFTIAYLVLNLRDGELVYSSGGHPPPLVQRADGGQEVLEAGGALIGMQAGGFEQGRVRLAPGDTVLVYTDGLLEYPGPGGELFGRRRLRAELRRRAGQGLEGMLDGLWGRLMDFGGSAEPPDDLSLLGVVYKGPGGGP